MKINYRPLPVIALLLLLQVAGLSQQQNHKTKQRIPAWVSAKGFWVAETNIKTPRLCTIYFYNNDKVLVYREKIEGMRVKLHRDRVKMHLKHVLETAVLAWERQHLQRNNDRLVISLLKKQ